MVVSIGAFAVASPDSFNFFVQKRIGNLTEELWPRKSRLIVEGFKDGEVVIAKGSNFELLARADTTMEVPDKVQVRYRNAEGVCIQPYPRADRMSLRQRSRCSCGSDDDGIVRCRRQFVVHDPGGGGK